MFRFRSISVFGSDLLSSEGKEKVMISKEEVVISKENCMISPDPSCTLDDTYIVDDSHFAPISEVVKRLSGNSLQFTGDEVAQSFDFADFKSVPSDFKVPFVRSSGYKDIAELSQHILETSKSASDSLQSDVNKEIERQEVQNIVTKAKSKQSSTTASE